MKFVVFPVGSFCFYRFRGLVFRTLSLCSVLGIYFLGLLLATSESQAQSDPCQAILDQGLFNTYVYERNESYSNNLRRFVQSEQFERYLNTRGTDLDFGFDGATFGLKDSGTVDTSEVKRFKEFVETSVDESMAEYAFQKLISRDVVQAWLQCRALEQSGLVQQYFYVEDVVGSSAPLGGADECVAQSKSVFVNVRINTGKPFELTRVTQFHANNLIASEGNPFGMGHDITSEEWVAGNFIIIDPKLPWRMTINIARGGRSIEMSGPPECFDPIIVEVPERPASVIGSLAKQTLIDGSSRVVDRELESGFVSVELSAHLRDGIRLLDGSTMYPVRTDSGIEIGAYDIGLTGNPAFANYDIGALVTSGHPANNGTWAHNSSVASRANANLYFYRFVYSEGTNVQELVETGYLLVEGTATKRFVSWEEWESFQSDPNQPGCFDLDCPTEPGPGPICPYDGGLISFVNPRGPVMDVDGTPATSDVMGQLYVGPTLNQLEAICEPIPVLLLGVFSGGETAVPGTVGGETVFVQLRAWKGASDFESATIRGQSEILTLKLKTPGELVPAPSLGIGSFRLAEVLPEARFVPPTLEGGKFILRWTGAGRLQESAFLNGPYRDSTNQSNPQEVRVSEAVSRFYRIVQD